MKRSIIIILSIIFILFISLVAWAFIDQSQKGGKDAVEIISVPKDVNIIVNDKSMSGNTIRLEPGKYVVSIGKDGFKPDTKTVTIYSDGRQNYIVGILNPVSTEAQEWANKNASEYTKAEGRVGDIETKNGELFASINPVVKHLPYTNYLFSIGYRKDTSSTDENAIIIEIKAPDVYKLQAANQLYNWGVDPVDYKINFNESNPFGDE